MNSDFIHLRTHSAYGLDSICGVRELVELAVEMEMPALALTDTNRMDGVIEFLSVAKEKGIKPIVGMELDIRSMPHFSGISSLTLLARNNQGYSNLCELSSIVNTFESDGVCGVDFETLQLFSDGLIALSGGRDGAVSSSILNGDVDAVERIAKDCRDLFGKDGFFLEVTYHGIRGESDVNKTLMEIGRKLNVGLVATSDVRYLRKSNADTFDVYRRILESSSTLKRLECVDFTRKEFYLRSPSEISAEFAEYPQAIANTSAIAEMCDVDLNLSEKSSIHWPKYECAPDEDATGRLKRLCDAGALKRYESTNAAISNRLDYELDVINHYGFADYFLILADVAEFVTERNIVITIRGAAGGSLVCHLLGISEIDPIRFGLPFEIFMNPEGIVFPQMYFEISQGGRKEISRHFVEKYGKERVAEIASHPTFSTSALIKDVNKVLGGAANIATELEAQRIKNEITRPRDLINLSAIKELAKEHPIAFDVIRHSDALRDLPRARRRHSCARILADVDLRTIAPLARNGAGNVCVQYNFVDCEKLGLLQLDFIEFDQLTVMKHASDLVRREVDEGWDVNEIPLDDDDTLNLFRTGDLEGIYQFNFQGMRELCVNSQIKSFSDIPNVIALFGFGGRCHQEDYLRCRCDPTLIEYLSPRLEPILNETCGIPLYQEQLQSIIAECAGISRGEADIMIRALAGGKQLLINEHQARFTTSCLANGIETKTTEAIWELIRREFRNVINKAHTISYALIAYRMAYLKTHHLEQFASALKKVQ